MSDVKRFDKGADVKLSENFHLSEWDCRCSYCSETLVDMDHVSRLQKLREDINAPVYITSGYRCEKHNRDVGGSENSQHKQGTATDIQVEDMDSNEVQDACEHFDGLGRYDDFTHVDSRGYRARWDKRSRDDYLPDGPSEQDIEIELKDIEDDVGI